VRRARSCTTQSAARVRQASDTHYQIGTQKLDDKGKHQQVIGSYGMALHLSKRGKYWFARGTVKWGAKSIIVRKSTGRTLRREAQEVADELYQQALNILKDGGRATAVPFSIAALNWIKFKKRGDTCRRNVKELGDFFKDYMAEEITDAAWRKYVDLVLNKSRPAASSAINRKRGTLISILRHAKLFNSEITKEEELDERNVFLSLEKQKELLSYYPQFAADLFYTYCYQGMRKSEGTLLLKQHVNLVDDLIYIRGETNHTGNSRFIPIHKKVKERLENLKNRDKSSSEYVFLNKNGTPYAKEGPRKVHDTARNKAGLPNFTIHDWRHHWASRLAMKGTTESALMELGGWKDPKMVQRYVTLGNDYKNSQLNLLE
jgi:integrase